MLHQINKDEQGRLCLVTFIPQNDADVAKLTAMLEGTQDEPELIQFIDRPVGKGKQK